MIIKDENILIKTKEKSYTTINSYINRLKNESEKRIIYCTDEISQSNALNLWTSQGVEVLMAETVVDTQFIPWIESKNNEVKFQRVDSEINSELQEEQKELLDKDGESDSDNLRNVVKEAINNE